MLAPVTLLDNAAREDLTRIVAALLAFAGIVISSPPGTKMVVQRCRQFVRQDMPVIVHRARIALGRWLPFVRPKPRTISASGSVRGPSPIARGRVRVRGPWPDEPTVDTLSEATLDRFEKLEGELNDVWREIDKERSDIRRHVEEVRSTLQEHLHSVREDSRRAEQEAAEHDVWAVPVLGTGAILGTLPDWFASWPWWLFFPIVGAAVVLAAGAAWNTLRYLAQ